MNQANESIVLFFLNGPFKKSLPHLPKNCLILFSKSDFVGAHVVQILESMKHDGKTIFSIEVA